MQDKLQDYCERAFPSKRGVRVSDLVELSPGWESRVFAFQLEHGTDDQRRHQQLILRLYSGGDVAHTGSAQEFRGMRWLFEAGYPVPKVLTLERDDSPFGQPFVIMERIDGPVLWTVLRGPRREDPWELLTTFCELLVRLHELEWRSFVPDASMRHVEDPFIFVDRELARLRSLLSPIPELGLQPFMEWLEAFRDEAPCIEPSPVHWDYHPSNLLLRDNGSMVVIDWTQMEVSDPRFDLAWTLVVVGTQQDPKWRDFILKEYERLRGASVDRLAYFEVAACLKRLGYVLVALSKGPEELGMRADAAAVITRLIGPIRRVGNLLAERTGIRTAEVDRVLAEYAPGQS